MDLEYKLLVSQNQFVLRHFFPRNIVLFNEVIYFKVVYSKCTWDKALCGGKGEEVQSAKAGQGQTPHLTGSQAYWGRYRINRIRLNPKTRQHCRILHQMTPVGRRSSRNGSLASQIRLLV